MAITAGARPGAAFARWLGEVASFGADAIQVREKGLSDAQRFDLVRQAKTLLPRGVSVLINGRVDICLAASSEGVHLPSDGIETDSAVELLRGQGLVGRATHALEEIEQAQRLGADYVTFGPVFATPGKGPEGRPTGLEALRQATEIGLPVLALGGVTNEVRERKCRQAGAWGIAAIRLFDRLARS
jgi:thiamine-phosphate pyrophosphorylase